MTLDPIQLRVLGSLIEKEIATPENYPLSLNALVNACNQRSSRDPVLDLAEDQVNQALHSLQDLALVAPVHDGRVPKYEHRIRTVLNLRRDETAVLCLLMLRGPQTPGELRSRADRLYSFDDLAAVQSTLDRLAARDAGDEGARHGPAHHDPSQTAWLPRVPLCAFTRRAARTDLPPVAHRTKPQQKALPTALLAVATEHLARLEEQLSTLSAALQALQTRVERLEAEHSTGDDGVSLSSLIQPRSRSVRWRGTKSRPCRTRPSTIRSRIPNAVPVFAGKPMPNMTI